MTGASHPPVQPAWVPGALLGLVLVACLLSGSVLSGRSVDHYLLPAPGGGTTTVTSAHLERVVLAALAWVTAAAAAAALVITLLARRMPRWAWVVLGISTLIVLNAALVIYALPQPSY